MKRWIPYALLVLCLVGWFHTWRSKTVVEPGLIVIADPDHYPDSVRWLPPRWFRLTGYTSHCLVMDNVTKTIRPFYENTMCRHEAENAIGKFPDFVTAPPRVPPLHP